jgi:hypothetical protein
MVFVRSPRTFSGHAVDCFPHDLAINEPVVFRINAISFAPYYEIKDHNATD